MRAFITGITGFAGTHLAEHLLDCGDQLLGCASEPSWRPDVPPRLAGSVPLIRWDIRQPLPQASWKRLQSFQPECIYHLAAMSIPADCGRCEPTEAAWAVNVAGTGAVLELACALEPPPRVLLVSSCYVYAPIAPDQPLVDETAPVGPVTGYGKTKLAAEQLLQEAVAQNGLDGLVARVFQHCGPRQSPRLMVAEWASQLVRGVNPVRVFNLETWLDLTDVRDTVRAYRLLIERGRRGGVYNVGQGRSVCSGEVFEQLRRQYDPAREVVQLSPGRRQNPIAAIGRLQHQTGWRPEIPLAQTLADTLADWQQRQGQPASPRTVRRQSA